ncbi:hypothetical protein B0A50_02546 [Salinomyces thailandicus]|uniref:Mitochondrial carrier protein n=1 Tax=Salinomyces thailandicus TaxID=706561 RepID=A0A4V5N5S4_9PEZI|nr:hypothetical protein B0A50_02546 [Salinomyces thailandica]
MSADFWAGYGSGAIGILIGNPLDLIKTKIQAGNVPLAAHSSPVTSAAGSEPVKPSRQWSSFARGAAAPILGYGALNALLFVTYNRSLALLNSGQTLESSNDPSAWSLWTAGALGGLAIFFVSAPTELVKCRAQVSEPPRSSWDVTRELWRQGGLRRLYLGGGVTSIRDAVGYGFYFWSYELSKRWIAKENQTSNEEGVRILLCGGLAGVVTWASVFPLDVIKTRVQTWDLVHAQGTHSVEAATQPLLRSNTAPATTAKPARPSTFQIAKQAYAHEGIGVFFRGLGICSARAFIVNAVQWATYEWMMRVLAV